MKESNIVHQSGDYWVAKTDRYTVYKDGITHARADSSYLMDADGKSIAIARCNYLARKGAA